MNLTQFTKISTTELNAYFVEVEKAHVEGRLTTKEEDSVMSFPSIAVVTETRHHFAVELVGSRQHHKKDMRCTRRKLEGNDALLGQFAHPSNTLAVYEFSETHQGIVGMAVLTPQANVEMERRYPGLLSSFATKIVGDFDGIGPAVRVTSEANFLRLEQVLLVNSQGGAVRAKAINFLLMIRKDTTPSDYTAYLRTQLNVKEGAELNAVRPVSRGEAQLLRNAADFANVFLMDQLHETAIGSYLEENKEILLLALDAKDVIAQPKLPWIVASPDPDEQYLQPDLLVQRQDGFWDVYDLKLALTDKPSITTGKRKRRGFIYSVQQGINQLGHYKEFLEIPQHAEYLEREFGVKFDHPRFVLVAGNYENADPSEVAEAKRLLGNFDLIDYDTMLQIYLAKARLKLPTSTADSHEQS